MAKKKSRGKRKSQRRSVSPRPAVLEASPANAEVTAKVQDLSDEYRYVSEDLIRIGIIAAILIGALVGLSFFL